MNRQPKPYYRNPRVDFYIEDGCCTACLLPEYYAPDLMGFDQADSHCFVARQPVTDDEVYRMIKVARSAETECVRYAGKDPQILRRMAQAAAIKSCDHQSLIYGIKPLLRNHVIFQSSQIESEGDLAQDFKNYLLKQEKAEYYHYEFSKIVAEQSGVSFSYSWNENKFYPIWFDRVESENIWHVYHSLKIEEPASQSNSILIDEWLRASRNFNNIRWFSNKGWNKSLTEWQSTPV